MAKLPGLPKGAKLYARRQVDADAGRHAGRDADVAIAIRAKMQPVGWEKGLTPRPAFVSAETHDLIALHCTAVFLVAAFLVIEAVGRGEIAKECCSTN
jgi:hypothetical protein